jgi:DNA-binding PadR family transcriptional regulator
MHAALRRCEHDGLLRSERDADGRRYELTAAGRDPQRQRFRQTPRVS